MNYFSYFKDENSSFIYTVDMVRLSVHLFKKDVSKLLFLLQTHCDEYWEDNRFGKYSQNFKFKNLWFGLGTPSKIDKPTVLFTCEFNPNKVDKDTWQVFSIFDKYFCHKWILKRFDLAVDVPYNINDIRFFALKKKSYSVFYKNYDDKTFYFGKGNGRIKVYNKAIESDLDYELTRFEVTIETNCSISDVPLFQFNFPDISFQEFISNEKNDTLNAIQFALNQGFPYSSLSRSYKSFFIHNALLNDTIRDDFCNKAIKNFLVSFSTPRF